MERNEIDSAIKEIVSDTPDGDPWLKWARRWLMGIDRSAEFARKFSKSINSKGTIAEAAVLWIEAQRLKDGEEKETKLRESYRLCLISRGLL